MNHLKGLIREVPDFPKPGILFYDITTLLKDSVGLKSVIDGLGAIDTVWGSKRAGLSLRLRSRQRQPSEQKRREQTWWSSLPVHNTPSHVFS